MAIFITKQDKIDEYFERPEVNQSSLKDLKDGLNNFLASIAKKQKDKEENKPTPDYFLIGGAVDCILTGEEGEFEAKYYVSPLDKKPTEVEIKIIESVFEELKHAGMLQQMEFFDAYDAILAAANEFSWQSRWKDETRVSKIIEAGTDYYEDLKKSFGKEIISSEMYEKIQNICKSLRTNSRTKKYFDREMQSKQENMDFYYQLPIYFSYQGIECKALMDLVVVHKNAQGDIINIEPIDLKTMAGDTLQFNSKIKQHRYDIQAAWYVLALCKYFNVTPAMIERFKFIVESTTNVGTPLVFRISSQTLNHGIEGAPEGYFVSEDEGRELYYPEVKGYKQLMAEYIYYSEQGFKMDKALVDNEDIIELDWTVGIVKRI